MADIYLYSKDVKQIGEMASFAQSSGFGACLISLGESVSEEIQNSGVDSIIQLAGSSSLPETYAAAVATLLKERNAKAFLVESSARGRDIAAHVAGILDAPMLSDVSSLQINESGLLGEHVLYGGLMLRTVSIEGFGVATVQAGFCDAALSPGQPAQIEVIDNTQVDERIELVESQAIVKSGTDLALAPVIVCVGLGLEKKDDILLADRLAQDCGGAVGCTRGVAEDREWMPAECYIGISGKILSPDLYLGIAVSGQVQHTYGIRGAKIIAAINVDENSPMVMSSDYAVIGDYKEILPLLNDSLCG